MFETVFNFIYLTDIILLFETDTLTLSEWQFFC